MILTLF